MESSDVEQLLRRCEHGDQEALTELIGRYQKQVFEFTLRISGDATLAEEATVNCFYQIWRKCGQQSELSKAEAWIFRVAHSTLLDLMRSKTRWWNRLISGAGSGESTSPGPLEAIIHDEQQQQLTKRIHDAIASLKEEDRALVHLYYFESMQLSEISEVLDTSVPTLKMRLSRIRQRLGKILESKDVPG